MIEISEYISQLIVGEPVVHQNLTLFPLIGPDLGKPDYLTLDEALSEQSASVTEVSAGGSVPNLKFVNRGAKPVLLLDGEELIGAKQNRILNLTILAPANKTIEIPVSCVEAGRWSEKSDEFAATPRARFAEGRRAKMMNVTASLAQSGDRRSDQSDVWDRVAEKAERLGARSSTGAMAEIFEKHTTRLEDYTAAFQPVDRQVGALFAINGKVNGLDLFDCPPTLAKLLPKLIRSYALDALDGLASGETAPAAKMDRAAALLKAAAESEVSTYPALGLGEDIRLTGARFAGGALAWNGRVVHLGGFKLRDGSQDDAATTHPGMARASSRRRLVEQRID